MSDDDATVLSPPLKFTQKKKDAPCGFDATRDPKGKSRTVMDCVDSKDGKTKDCTPSTVQDYDWHLKQRRCNVSEEYTINSVKRIRQCNEAAVQGSQPPRCSTHYRVGGTVVTTTGGEEAAEESPSSAPNAPKAPTPPETSVPRPPPLPGQGTGLTASGKAKKNKGKAGTCGAETRAGTQCQA